MTDRGSADRTGGAERGAESARLAAADAGQEPWRAWGPYLAERAWGTVREDYSDDGSAWDSFPHEQARSRAYRWNEDGLAGLCDDRQTFCFALAFWNGEDSILKERIFGLSGPQGNHGEDAKEHWWYLDSTPTHSFMRWRYHYPQRAFPYADLIAANAARGRDEPEYELLDTGVFDDARYWAVTVDYAKASPTDVCVRITVRNHGPQTATLHVLPSLWFRNTWAWDPSGGTEMPRIHGYPGALVAHHAELGRLVLAGEAGAAPLVCDNESHAELLWGRPGRSRYAKDGIGEHVIHGRPTVNPDRVGTKAALHHVVTVRAGSCHEIRLRLVRVDTSEREQDLGVGFEAVLAAREREADEFFTALMADLPAHSADEATVVCQAIAGLMWGKQFYHYDVARWRDGDPSGTPTGTTPPQGTRAHARNANWRHLAAFDVISMPDPWEFPWFAAWDLAFQAVAIARVDPGFAKQQLLLLLDERYQHPDGRLPACEWDFDDANPPVHAWAALRVFQLDGARDHEFLRRVLRGLTPNFTWWTDHSSGDGSHVFEGGFLGLDNVGPFNRSAPLPVPGTLKQSDAAAWTALYALNLLEMAIALVTSQPDHADAAMTHLAIAYCDRFAEIIAGLDELWDDEEAFFFDAIWQPDGHKVPIKVRSIVGLLPLAAALCLPAEALDRLPWLAARLRELAHDRPERAGVLGAERVRDGRRYLLLAAVDDKRLQQILERMLDPAEFLSPYGLRSLSRAHAEAPVTLRLPGEAPEEVSSAEFSVGYEPGESATAMFGGNSNWRGPVWFPVNYLLIDALRRYAAYFGDDLVVACPTGSGQQLPLGDVADELSRRLVSIFLRDASGRRPMHGSSALLQHDERWRDLIAFHEYFHGETGAGLGAAHQTGWTALVADLIMRDAAARDRDRRHH